MRCFQRKFNVTKEPENDTMKALYGEFHATGSCNEDRAGNVGGLPAAVTNANVHAVQQFIHGSSRVSVSRIVAQARIRRMSEHRIMPHKIHLFPYKIETSRTLNTPAINARQTFANAMLHQLNTR